MADEVVGEVSRKTFNKLRMLGEDLLVKDPNDLIIFLINHYKKHKERDD